MISICSLIYRSRKYADAVWDSAHEFTPELKTGDARFFFVANDATPEVLAHLVEKNYPHVIQNNEVISDKALAGLGFDAPEYIRRVYLGWNRALRESDDQAVLVNSDCMFSPGWLAGLLEYASPRHMVCSKIVERVHPKHGRFKHALAGDFGDHPDRFKKSEFLEFAKRHSKDGTEPGGAYMPCLVHKDVGRYPEGNPRGTYGDKQFVKNISARGVSHITSLSSIVYHFKEGEMSE